MIEFWFGALRSDLPVRALRDGLDVRIRVIADLTIFVNSRVVYSEVDFPVVELAAALVHWCDLPENDRNDFEFDSMSTPEPGWVWIRHQSDGWRVGSLYQEHPEMAEFTSEEICAAVRRFADLLVVAGRNLLGLDLPAWVPTLAPR